MKIFTKRLPDFTPEELYSMLQLRQDVFIVEQNCVYRDMDEKDFECYHLCIEIDKKVIACCRLVPPGISYSEASIGRVCTSPSVRLEKFGIRLMEEAMLEMERLWPGINICISAQLYLEKFYTRFGFQSEGQPYPEDDIPHIKMRYRK